MGDSSLTDDVSSVSMKSKLNIPHTTSSIIANDNDHDPTKGGIIPNGGSDGPPINPIEHDDRFNYALLLGKMLYRRCVYVRCVVLSLMH